MLYRRLTSLALALLAIAICALPATALDYPQTRTVEQVDDYHGTPVADPYRWLEDPTSPEVQTWVDAENALTRSVIDAIPGRDGIAERLRTVANYERFSAPSQTAGRYFWSKNDGLQNHYVTYWSEGLDGEPQVLLDPNTWSPDGSISLAGMDISDDGKWLLYATSTAGSDWVEWFVREIDTGQQLADHIVWSKGGGMWNADASGFWYERFPEPKAGEEYTVAAANPMYYFHVLGTPQSEDKLVYSIPEHPDWWIGAGLNERRDRMVVTTGAPGSNNNDYAYVELSEPGFTLHKLIPERTGEYSYVYDEGPLFWFHTTEDAPNGKLVQIDIRQPARENWVTVIPESEYKLSGVGTCGGFFWAYYSKDTSTRIYQYSTDGQRLAEVKLPGRGSAGGFGGRMKDMETFYTYTDMTTPASIYHYDIAASKSTLFKQTTLDLDLSAYESRLLFARGKDGMAVPMYVMHRKGIKLDSSNPTILYGYGGFQGGISPYFSSFRSVWLDMGGVYVVAGIRGGDEYGDAWHKGAVKTKKQATFDDFIACAEYLIDQGYTSTGRLAINGASNGGLLVGAVMTQRPELFAVALPDVGVMDMLRYELWGFGKYWASDYGSASNPDEFRTLYSYSPYHNIKPGTRYPATFVTTADTDDRVMPGHSYKFAARLQAAQLKDGPPVLLRVQVDAGHGAGKPFYKVIEETADTYAFCFDSMGLEVPQL